MSHIAQQELDSLAHRLYREGKFEEALQLNRQALADARQRKDLPAQVTELRNVGLCLYRLHQYQDSEDHLEEARSLARQLGDKLNELFLVNHLGATLRESGKLLQAYQLFETALAESEPPEYRQARMRLLGNFGALLDELGQRHRADELYARYEELANIEGNVNRQANARGLVARTAELRNDLALARRKYFEEAALARQAGDVLRVLAAELHEARITAKLGPPDKAERLFEVALQHSREVGNAKRLMDALEGFAEFLREQHQLPRAYALLSKAQRLCERGPRYPEKAANISARLALLCADAGLHGEALAHLSSSVNIRYQLYEPLRQDPTIRKLAQARLSELAGMANELIDEACQVVRTQEEQAQFLALHNRLRGKETSMDELLADRDARRRDFERLWEWSKRLRQESQQRWKERLLPGCFERLSHETQNELVKADVAYSGAVDDLSRSLLVLATAVERELRIRLVAPFLTDKDKSKHLTLGKLLRLSHAVLDGGMNSTCPKLSAELAKRRDSLQPYRPIIRALLIPLRLMSGEPLKGADGTLHTFVTLRNAAAHGSEQKTGLQINRLIVDAVKRLLVLEEPPVLRRLAELDPLSP